MFASLRHIECCILWPQKADIVPQVKISSRSAFHLGGKWHISVYVFWWDKHVDIHFVCPYLNLIKSHWQKKTFACLRWLKMTLWGVSEEILSHDPREHSQLLWSWLNETDLMSSMETRLWDMSAVDISGLITMSFTVGWQDGKLAKMPWEMRSHSVTWLTDLRCPAV